MKPVTRSLKLIDADLRENPERQPAVPESCSPRGTSRRPCCGRMNEAGVLGRFMPDFGQIVAMMQFNMYHHYTVDEHLIRVDRRAVRHRPRRAQPRSIRSPTC